MFWLVLASILLLYCLYNELFAKRKGLPPGPTPLPFFGNVLQLDRNGPHKTLAKWAEKYGPIMTVWLGPQANIVLNDFDIIRESLTGKNADSFTGRPDNYLFQEMLKGKYGLVTTDGQFWREQRRFSLHVLRNFGFGRNLMAEKILNQADALAAMIDQEIGANSSKILNLEFPIQLCVGNIISALVFGHTFEEDRSKFSELTGILEENFNLIGRPEVALLILYPFLRHIPLFNWFRYPQVMKNSEKMTEFLEKEVELHKSEFDPYKEPTDYIEAYLKEMNHLQESGQPQKSFSEWQLVMALGDLWAAGMETTVTTLRWAFLFLATHPEVQNKLHKELDAFYDSSEARDISMADKLHLPYTAATIHEVQRLANILPINLQHTVTADVQVAGYCLPKGTVVIPQMASVHLNEKIFPNPQRFEPDRFLNTDESVAQKVIPFSMGKRQCLGESLARMELFLIFVTLLKSFKFSVVDENNPPSLEPVVGITLTTKPYDVLVTRK